MRILIRGVSLILFVNFISCNNESAEQIQTIIDDTNLQLHEEKIKAVLNDMWDAIEKEDIDRYASFIHPDFTQFGETDPVLKIGKDIEVNGVKEWVKNSSNIHTEMQEPRVVINGNVAWITYYWKDRGTTNNETFSSKGKSTRIFVRENERWLCIHGHYTLLPSS